MSEARCVEKTASVRLGFDVRINNDCVFEGMDDMEDAHKEIIRDVREVAA